MNTIIHQIKSRTHFKITSQPKKTLMRVAIFVFIAILATSLKISHANNGDDVSKSSMANNEFNEVKITDAPSFSSSPSMLRSKRPTMLPSGTPSSTPSTSFLPSSLSSSEPTMNPSENPTNLPTTTFTPSSSTLPSSLPSFIPSISSSMTPTETTQPTTLPSQSSVPSSTPTMTPTSSPFVPGLLQALNEHNIALSQGLASKIIARTGHHVKYANGNHSHIKFHRNPDGGAVIVDPNGSGDYVYVSNSEVGDDEGGVGAIRFDQDGNVLDYRMVLEGTNDNCSGGVTPWHTWISCEEYKGIQGQIYEVDPFGHYPANKTILGGEGGNYETVTVDNTNTSLPIFYISNDNSDGEIRRFTPNATIVQNGDYSKILISPGTMHYLVLDPDTDTFQWTLNLAKGQRSARRYFRNVEGIDYRHGLLYFVSKVQDELFTLDLAHHTYVKESTVNGYFQDHPDQVIRYMNEPSSGMMFFTEEGNNGGVHGRDVNGNYFTLLEGGKINETSGLAFSPDNKRMYVAFYNEGILFEITRTDGLPFSAEGTTLRHHQMNGSTI